MSDQENVVLEDETLSLDVIHEDLSAIHDILLDVQISLAEDPYADTLFSIQQQLELLDGKLVDPVQVDDFLCVPVWNPLEIESGVVDGSTSVLQEGTEAEAVLDELETDAAKTDVPSVAADTAVTVEDMQALLVSVREVNTHLIQLEGYQQNLQNIQIPIMGGIALVFGAVLALICSNYIKH